MKEVVIICGGASDPALDQVTNWIVPYQVVHWIGVDRGALRLVQAGYSLDMAVGDFDSVDEKERNTIATHSRTVQRLQAEKDDTDMEIALTLAMQTWPQADYLIFGALGEHGGRLDHGLCNVWLAYQPRFKAALARLTFVERHHIGRFYLPGDYRLDYQPCRYLSIISLTPVEQLQIQGAKYQLPPTDFAYPRALISNEYQPTRESVQFSFTSGLIFVIWVNQL